MIPAPGHDRRIVAIGRWNPLGPNEVLQLLRNLDARWWIAGGWALDLFVGTQTRPHDDVDVEMPRGEQGLLWQILDGWDLQVAAYGTVRPWSVKERLEAPLNSIWARPRPDTPWRMQVMFGRVEGDRWIYRRDPRIVRPLAEIGMTTADGVPFIAPEIQLLYKAAQPRPKDDADFLRTLPLLPAERRDWLYGTLRTLYPHHPWLRLLDP